MSKVNDSEFYMWRALFAMAHADNIVTDEEVRFLAEVLEDVPFTDEQRRKLTDDIATPQDVVEMFEKISEPKDQARFFKFAHDLVWVDGEYGADEQRMMLKLKEAHIRSTNVDDLIGNIEIQFDDEVARGAKAPKRERNAKEVVFSFREQFFRDRGQ